LGVATFCRAFVEPAFRLADFWFAGTPGIKLKERADLKVGATKQIYDSPE
jgi:hypothetical protein